MVTFQGSLFDDGTDPWPRPLDGAVCRTLLDGGAWVDHLPAWMARPDLLFERLMEVVPWRAERRTMYARTVEVPRLLAFYGAGDTLPDPVLDEARSALTAHYRGVPGGAMETTGLCLYRDGSDSVAWHGDTIGRGATEDTIVAILSLGSPRRLVLRPRGGRAGSRFDLGGGDLLVMGGSCQRTWEHSVPKTTRPIGPRISVQFRPCGVR